MLIFRAAPSGFRRIFSMTCRARAGSCSGELSRLKEISLG
jgi:hypothetical protein